jgi:hypothetical protein
MIANGALAANTPSGFSSLAAGRERLFAEFELVSYDLKRMHLPCGHERVERGFRDFQRGSGLRRAD